MMKSILEGLNFWYGSHKTTCDALTLTGHTTLRIPDISHVNM